MVQQGGVLHNSCSISVASQIPTADFLSSAAYALPCLLPVSLSISLKKVQPQPDTLSNTPVYPLTKHASHICSDPIPLHQPQTSTLYIKGILYTRLCFLLKSGFHSRHTRAQWPPIRCSICWSLHLSFSGLCTALDNFKIATVGGPFVFFQLPQTSSDFFTSRHPASECLRTETFNIYYLILISNY